MLNSIKQTQKILNQQAKLEKKITCFPHPSNPPLELVMELALLQNTNHNMVEYLRPQDRKAVYGA